MKPFERVLALLAGAMLAAAVPVATEPAAPQPAPALVALDADQAALGAWLGRLHRIQRPVQEAMASAGNGVQALMTARDPARAAADYRTTIASLIATVDTADAELATLDTPDFPALELPAELRPAAIKAATHELNRNIRAGFQAYLPLLDALVRHDMAAAQRAFGPSMSRMTLMLESQLLLVRAQQAPIPRATSVWEMVNVQVLYHRVAVRLAQAWPPASATPNGAGVARSLLELADELERTADTGDAKADAELEAANVALAGMQRRGGGLDATVLRRRILVLTSGRAYFPLARDFAALLRRDAPAITGRTFGPAAFVAQFQRLYPFRDRIMEIERGLAAAIAEAG